MDLEATPGASVRRLWTADLPHFRDHLLRLDRRSRRDRFGMAVSDSFVIHYAERCVGVEDVLYGYFVEGVMRGAGELRAVGHNLPLGFGGRAEAAFSVETEWRRHGVGSELMRRIVRAARNRRAGELTMACLTSNVAMMKLAQKFAADLRYEEDEAEGHVAARAPSPASMAGEMGETIAGFATALVDLQLRVFGGRP